MKQMCLCVVLATIWASSVLAKEKGESLVVTCENEPTYRFVRNNIFDPEQTGFTWIHELGNRFHITTKEVTLENEIAGFTPCDDQVDDLYELERYLRKQSYLRDAKVERAETQSGESVIQVTTWDTWSLLPTFDFSRSGGENSGSIGVKDSNFLGFGIDAEVQYFSDVDRDGYLLDLSTPLFLKQNLKLKLKLAENSDGNEFALGLHRPFVSKRSRYAWEIYLNDLEQEQTIRQGDEEVNEFGHEQLHYRAWYGWSPGEKREWIWRYRVGINREKDRFEPLPSDTTLLPDDRDKLELWFGISAHQDRFTKRTNVFLINGFEDINLGLDWSLRFGRDIREDGWIAAGQLSWGNEFHPKLLWLTQWLAEGETLSRERNRWIAQWKQEWFYRLTDPVRLYGKLNLVSSDNPYIDHPITLDEDNGVRGFPLQYQHGERFVQATLETRIYPDINLWQMFDVGGAVFYDYGRISGDSDYDNNPTGSLQSVGAGLRFFASRASSSRILHLDFARPISDDPRLDDWEWRLEVKNHF